MQTYLTIGTDRILEEYMQSIVDSNMNYGIKPIGGLWFTKYDLNNPNYSLWLDYILDRLHIAFYKGQGSNFFLQHGVVITLKNKARIYNLKDKASLDYLLENYQDNNGRVSYEKLSEDYDGVYVEVFSLYGCDNPLAKEFLHIYGVDSLILFNLSVIDSYKKVEINIEPFDVEVKNSEVYYEIKFKDEVNYVVMAAEEYRILLKKIILEMKDLLLELKRKYRNINNTKLICDIFEIVEDKYGKEIEEMACKEGLEVKKLTLSFTTKCLKGSDNFGIN